MVTETIKKELNTQDHGDDATECMLCENSETRHGKIFDDIVKGQSLFHLTPLGVSMVKHYGEETWSVVK